MYNQVDHLGAIIIRELNTRHIHLEECPDYEIVHPKLFPWGYEIKSGNKQVPP